MRFGAGSAALLLAAAAVAAQEAPRSESGPAVASAPPASEKVLAVAPAAAPPAETALAAAPSDSSSAAGQDAADLQGSLRDNTYFYGSFGTRDPFRSLLAGDFEPRIQELVDLHTVHLVGVMWELDEYIGMVQDGQGFGYDLRPGDAVKNGTVVSVSQDALVARLEIFGQTTQVTLRLQRQERGE